MKESQSQSHRISSVDRFEEQRNDLQSAYEEISTRRYKLIDDFIGYNLYTLRKHFWCSESWCNGFVPRLIRNILLHSIKELNENWPQLMSILAIFLYGHLNGIVMTLILSLLNRTALLFDSDDWRRIHSELRERFLWQSLLPFPIFMRYLLKTVIKCNYADEESRNFPRDEDFKILLINHYSRIDALFFHPYVICNRIVHRSIAHKMVRLHPALCSAYSPAGYLFVKPGSQLEDIGGQVRSLLKYDNITLSLLAEGNWPNKRTKQEADQLCHLKGVQPLRYHLVPRSKAFTASFCSLANGLKAYNEQKCAKGLSERRIKLINFQCFQPVRWKFWDIVRYRRFRVDFYLEHIELTDEHIQEALDSKNLNQDCPKLKQLLMSIYRRKDQLVERYKANGRQVDEQMSAAGSETVTIPASDMMLFVGFLVCNLKLVWFMWNLASPWSLVAQPLLWMIFAWGVVSFIFSLTLFSLDY